MNNLYSKIIFIILIILLSISFGAVFYTPLIFLVILVFFAILLLKRKGKQIGVRYIIILSIISIISFIFFTFFPRTLRPSIDDAKINFSKKQLRKIYTCYNQDKTQLPSLYQTISKEDTHTILQNTSLLVCGMNCSQDGGEKPPLALYYFHNIYNNRNFFIVLFRNGEIITFLGETKK